MTEKIVRLGIIGCGEVTQVIHLPTLHQLRDRFTLTALCDISAKVRDGVGDAWGVARRFADYRDLIADADVDAVLIANPHVYHAEAALAAMQAGRHVLIEKPMCITNAEADALITREAASGVVAQVGYMRRHAPAFAAAKARIAALTNIRLARVHDVLGRNALIVGQTATVIRPDDIPAEASEDMQALLSKRVAEAIGPAPRALENAYTLLLGLGTHDLSAMRELFGMPVRVLYAAHRGEDGRVISAALDYGAFVCQYETCIDAIPRFDAHIEVYTHNEVIRIDYDTPYVRNLPGRLTVTDVDAAGMARSSTSLAWRDSFLIEWTAFHDSIVNGMRPKTTPTDAREDLVLFLDMIAAMRSASETA